MLDTPIRLECSYLLCPLSGADISHGKWRQLVRVMVITLSDTLKFLPALVLVVSVWFGDNQFTIYLQNIIVEISLHSHRHVSASRIFFCMDTCAMDLRPESWPSNPTQVWESLMSHKGKVTRGSAVLLASWLPKVGMCLETVELSHLE
jgi:hypothetical protein